MSNNLFSIFIICSCLMNIIWYRALNKCIFVNMVLEIYIIGCGQCAKMHL